MSKSLYGRHNDVFLTLLRQSRESVQLRQADLARLLGRDQTTVSRVETGERRLDVLQLRLWLRALGVDFLAFMRELDQRLGDAPVLETIHPGTPSKPLIGVVGPARRSRN
ncbi:helix-turn-helix domain-containing protein [Piscinibacter sp. HJYY11]|uniref:helix-turn-helix domain-containing protein n=1 Tax=Piscinibacter sp. HJYY11 TaxID=2801333 RepID=UPI00191CE7C8|nr:helix-turn-helix transcriptional regulator [Piscinibacter sp. HJYY11]MBL0729577.1 helix-turn-helix transcriptional regulator [Piscinibacter sp. HJYY11]